MSQEESKAFVPHELRQEVVEKDDNNVPVIEVKTIPSRWKAYPPKSKIKYKPYTYGEALNYSQSKLSTAAGFEFILNGIEPSFPKEKLTLQDFFFIALLRKISSFGDIEFKIQFICSKCENPNEMVAKSTEFEFKDIEAPDLPIVVTFSDNIDYQFMPLTVGGYIELLEMEKQKDAVAISAMQCISHKFDKMYKKIYNLTDQVDSALMGKIDGMMNHTLKAVQRDCSHVGCGHSNKVVMDSGSVIIRPFRKRDELLEGRIHFGKKASNLSGASKEDGLRGSNGA
jgi:hypothetical protein